MKVSIIIPTHNASEKIGRCIASLRQQTIAASEYEVLFIDDASSDQTYKIITTACSGHSNWRSYRLDENSGSPSKPRNIGVKNSNGEFVFFLDCDDEIYPDTLEMHLAYAEEHQCDVVRGYLLVNNGTSLTPFNKINNWDHNLSKIKKIKTIIQKQSSTNTTLIKRSLLINNNIKWEEHIRMSEDTLFLADILSASECIGYIDHPTFVYNKLPATTASTTQNYGDRELNNHIEVWKEVEQRLKGTGVSYTNTRLGVGLKEAMLSLYFKNKTPISQNTFKKLSDFVNSNWQSIEKQKYIPKIVNIINSARNSDFEKFKDATKPVLLIAGYDLKFIKPYIESLKNNYRILIDEWTGHNQHNEEQSRHLLAEADYIWCEWLLGNAVWYSKNKKSHQIMVCRVHRFELARDFGNQIEIEKINAFITVSPYFLEELINTFPRIPRKKVRLIYNGVSTSGYTRIDINKSRFNIGMIGITPSRKGFDQALQILKTLHESDTNYKLHIFGDHPMDTTWIINDSTELKYYTSCFEYIESNALNEHIVFHGHSDMKSAMSKNNVGIILSLSNKDKRRPWPESFHLAIADAFASGGCALINNWPGAEYIWPKECIFNNHLELTQAIKYISHHTDELQRLSSIGRQILLNKYDANYLTDTIVQLLHESHHQKSP
jgi:glycosyltransferase involved in cell wall biosynthesis